VLVLQRFLILSSQSMTTTELYLLPSREPLSHQPKLVNKRQAGVEYFAEPFEVLFLHHSLAGPSPCCLMLFFVFSLSLSLSQSGSAVHHYKRRWRNQFQTGDRAHLKAGFELDHSSFSFLLFLPRFTYFRRLGIDSSNWKTLVPSSSTTSVDDVDVFEKFLVFFGTQNGLSLFRFFDFSIFVSPSFQRIVQALLPFLF
jgi:hypothetical protein